MKENTVKSKLLRITEREILKVIIFGGAMASHNLLVDRWKNTPYWSDEDTYAADNDEEVRIKTPDFITTPYGDLAYYYFDVKKHLKWVSKIEAISDKCKEVKKQ